MNSSRIRVKMCGMTRSEDIACAVQAGVDAVGLIFYPKSSRFVSVEQARELLRALPALVDAVAVVVNPERDLVQQIIDELPIQLLQFHGDESAEFCQQFKKPFIKAIHADSNAYIQQMAAEFAMAQALLLDTPSTAVRGGTGLAFDWTMIPPRFAMPYLLAGGIDEANVLAAIEQCHPYAVDLCSGIEASPGIKDHGKIKRFMQKLLNRE